MPLEPAQRHPVMCLTQDGLPISHVEQARRLCAAGAKWIQVRMKGVEDPREWINAAGTIVEICKSHGAICIVNDSVDVAIAAGAHGAHVSWRDCSWGEARRVLGKKRLLGGTVNNEADARRAARANCLDYVGIGPWRFTTTKQNLAPVLGETGVRGLIAQLDGLPAWVIGGLQPADLATVRRTGATGAAVSSALYRDGRVEENYRLFRTAWGPALEELRS